MAEKETPPPIPLKTREETCCTVVQQAAAPMATEETDSPRVITLFERTFQSGHSSSTMTTSEEMQRYEVRLEQLENQNKQSSIEILKLKQVCNEITNEAFILKDELKRAKKALAAANAEMEHYKIRAQRVLQEKDKMISYKQEHAESDGAESDKAMLAKYLEETK